MNRHRRSPLRAGFLGLIVLLLSLQACKTELEVQSREKFTYFRLDEFDRLRNFFLDDLTKQPEMRGLSHNEFTLRLLSRMVYPPQARANGTEGRVELYFVVEPDGNLLEPVIYTDIGDGCGERAKQALEETLEEVRFSGGEYRGQPYDIAVKIGLDFSLRD